MVFSSYLFLFYFLPLALLLYYTAPRRAQHFVLTVLSYVFYGWANPLFVGLLFISTVIDYVAGLVIARTYARTGGTSPPIPPTIERRAPVFRLQRVWRSSHPCAAISRCSDSSSISTSASTTSTRLLRPTGLDALQPRRRPARHAAARHQLLHVPVDELHASTCIAGTRTAIRSFIDFACFVSMFPQLVAGPIVRFSEVADQLRSRTHTVDEVRARRRVLLAWGWPRKCCSPTRAARSPTSRSTRARSHALDAWFGVTAYAFQIYFDFSGYSDMAIGLGLMLGFVFPKNFDSPYQSQSITEFWRRWHISLSTWLRDYLYVPLGGNRKGPLRTYVNLFIVMLLGGLWHGASWNFVVWGGTARRAARVRAHAREDGARTGGCPCPCESRCTFVDRAGHVGVLSRHRSDRRSRLSGVDGRLGAPHEGASLLAGIVYQPYYLLTFVVAALVTWSCPQTWDWSRTLTAPKAAGRQRRLGAGSRDADDAGVQPVHLFHLLMSTDATGIPRPTHRPGREEIAHIEVGHTTVSPRLARLLVAWFLLLLAALPLVEWLWPRAQAGNAQPRAWSHLADVPATMAERLRALDRDAADATWWTRVVTANRALLTGMSAFETALEDHSAVGRLLRPHTQVLLTGWLGAGNERVYPGRDRWLFYRPDVEYLTGKGFLDPRQMRRRVASAGEIDTAPQPDPLLAIRQFKRDLDARGIALVLVPTPVKPSVHPEQLAIEHRAGDALQNASYGEFVDDARTRGLAGLRSRDRDDRRAPGKQRFALLRNRHALAT